MHPNIRTTLLDTEAIHLALTKFEQSFTTRENVAAAMGAAVRVLEAREVMGDAARAAPGVPAASKLSDERIEEIISKWQRTTNDAMELCRAVESAVLAPAAPAGISQQAGGAVPACPRGCTGPDEGGSGCAAVYGECAMPYAPNPALAVPVQADRGEEMTTDESREYLVDFMMAHFTDKTFHRYIRGQRGQVNLAGDFAWQMARALKRLAAPVAPPASPSEESMPPEFIDKLKSIADWMDSSAQQQQISPEEFAHVNQFDYELAQAASEIYGIIGALPGSTPDAAQGGA